MVAIIWVAYKYKYTDEKELISDKTKLTHMQEKLGLFNLDSTDI